MTRVATGGEAGQETRPGGPWRWYMDALTDSLRYTYVLLPLWVICAFLATISFLFCGIGEFFVIPPLMCGLLALNFSIVRGYGCRLGEFFGHLKVGLIAIRPGFKCFVAILIAGIISVIIGAGLEAACRPNELGSLLGLAVCYLLPGFACYTLTYTFLGLVDSSARSGAEEAKVVLASSLWRGFSLRGLMLFGLVAFGFVLIFLGCGGVMVAVASLVCKVSGQPMLTHQTISQMRGTEFEQNWIVIWSCLALICGSAFGLGVSGMALTHAHDALLPAGVRPVSYSRRRRSYWPAAVVGAAMFVLWMLGGLVIEQAERKQRQPPTPPSMGGADANGADKSSVVPTEAGNAPTLEQRETPRTKPQPEMADRSTSPSKAPGQGPETMSVVEQSVSLNDNPVVPPCDLNLGPALLETFKPGRSFGRLNPPWHNYLGSMLLQSGELQVNLRKFYVWDFSLYPSSSWRDFSVQAEFLHRSAKLGLLVRYDDKSGDCYEFLLVHEEKAGGYHDEPSIQFSKYRLERDAPNGTLRRANEVVLAHKSFVLAHDRFHNLRIDVAGNRLWARIDNACVLFAEDGTGNGPQHGGIGLSASTGCFQPSIGTIRHLRVQELVK